MESIQNTPRQQILSTKESTSEGRVGGMGTASGSDKDKTAGVSAGVGFKDKEGSLCWVELVSPDWTG